MKKILLLLVIINTLSNLSAQVGVEPPACLPDSTFQDSTAGAFPLPLDAAGNFGLAEFPACINEPYELIFTIKLGDSISVAGVGRVDVVSANIERTGAITGLPEGLTYFCNPPDCIFPDTTLGCIVVTGTPTESNTIGDNPLVIAGVAVLNLGALVEFPLEFPGTIASGEYNISLNAEGDCVNDSSTVSTHNYLSEKISLGNTPNPVSTSTKIEMTSLLAGDFQFTVFDMAGKAKYQESVSLRVGYNTLNFDASGLQDGFYIYTLSDGTAYIAEKMMVRK